MAVPYIALATTTPLLSRWLAHIEPTLNPVRFFAASNVGSFLGLLTYPFFFERLLTSPQQTRWWSWAYALYAALFVLCGWLTWRRSPDGDRAQPASTSITGADDPWLLWVAYSGLGSALLVATTNAITQWSAVVPFLWVVPLSVYLLTFIVTFAYPRAYHRLAFGSTFLLLAGFAFLQPVPESSYALFQQLVLQTAILFAGCMICHGELVRLQPEPARLPKFYLAVAAGGALGGICVVLLAPAPVQRLLRASAGARHHRRRCVRPHAAARAVAQGDAGHRRPDHPRRRVLCGQPRRRFPRGADGQHRG